MKVSDTCQSWQFFDLVLFLGEERSRDQATFIDKLGDRIYYDAMIKYELFISNRRFLFLEELTIFLSKWACSLAWVSISPNKKAILKYFADSRRM